MKALQTAIFVGRHEELDQLDAILTAVQGGNGRCVFISGEAGIGKSHLVAAIGERGSEAGYSVLTGRCFEQDRSFPYAPLIDMLRSLFAFGEGDGALQGALDSLGPLAAELSPRSSLSSSAAPETRIEKRQLFEGLTRLYFQQAEAAPLILVVEDLHWSDQASLEFLLYFVRRIARYPILLLLTARTARAQPALVELLAGLDREPIAQEITLDPLSKVEVAQLIKAILEQAQEPSVEFVETIYRLSEGNPFFAEEICKSLIASGDIYYLKGQWQRKPLAQIDIPDSIQRVVQRSLERISQPARQLIDLAAVSGRSFDFSVLQVLTGQGDRELLDLVKELMAARLVVEESVDQFSFRHALTREALYSQLLVRERQKLHGQLVAAIEQVHAGSLESHLEALAYHAYEAGLWSKTVDYAWRAGEKALALYAPQAALEQFTRALRAAERLPLAPAPALYRLRGQAYDTLGNFDEARADYETALQAARAADEQQLTWQLLLDLGLLWASRDYERTGDYCREALELARSVEDRAAVGHSLNRMGNWLMNSGQPFEALDYHREALTLFEELDDGASIARTLDLLAMSSNQSGDATATVSYYERAIPILRELKDWQTLSSSLANLSLYTLDLAQANEAVKLAHDIGWHSGEAYALNCLSLALFNWGRYGESLTLRSQSLQISQAIEHPQWIAGNLIYYGLCYSELLDRTKAEKHLAEGLVLARQVGSTFFSWMASGTLASVYILQGQLDAAEKLLAGLPQEWMPSLFTVRLARAQLALARQDPASVLQLLDELLAVPIATEKAIGMLSLFQGPAIALQAQALLLLRRLEEAEQLLLQTVALYEKHGLIHGLWRIHLLLGEIYLEVSQTEKAKKMFLAATTQINTLAATIDDEALRENFRRRATEMIPEFQPLTPRQKVKHEYGGLTRREREVAAVIVRGLTNQEIADELVVSIKTVEAHITRILSKLGFTSRSQIAAWAVEKGLAAAPQDLDSRS